VDVTLPDGTRIRASSILERDDNDSTRAFGLYMDERWGPTWPAEIVAWPDFGLPLHPEHAAAQIQRAYSRARGGETVEIGCIGGRGRTGTVLACLAVLAGVNPPEAVAWVRKNYRSDAVENVEQETWVDWFAEYIQRQGA
jgi:hypothetical protein